MNRYLLPRIFALIAFALGQFMLYMVDANYYVQILYALLFLGIFIGQQTAGYIFVYRVVTPVAIGIFFTLLYRYAYEYDFIRSWLSSTVKVEFMLNKFFDVVSTLYAICVAFLLWKGLMDHDNLKSTLNSEASQIRCIINYTKYFQGEKNIKVIERFYKLLHSYIENILRNERIVNRSENDKILQECVTTINELDVEDFNDKVALEEIMKGLSQLSEIRSKRQSLIDTKMSPYLLLSLFIMTISIIYPLFTKSPEIAGSVGYVMVFTMSTLLFFMFITMLDLRDPFAGFWRIKIDAFKSIHEELSRLVKEQH